MGAHGPMVVVTGISGSGKSTLGEALATRLGVPFVEGDDLHPQANRDKMAAGHPLDDADRAPWLDRIAETLLAHHDGVVVTCSALKRKYRDRLREAVPNLEFVHLDASPDVLRERLEHRQGHYMKAGMLDSQLATFEPYASDEPHLVLDAARPPEEILERALEHLG